MSGIVTAAVRAVGGAIARTLSSPARLARRAATATVGARATVVPRGAVDGTISALPLLLPFALLTPLATLVNLI